MKIISSVLPNEPLQNAGDKLSLYYYPARWRTEIREALYLCPALIILGLPGYAWVSNYQPPPGKEFLLMFLLPAAGIALLGRRFRYHFRRPGLAGESVEVTSTELRFQENLWVDSQVGGYWWQREGSVARAAVRSIQAVQATPALDIQLRATCGDLNAPSVERGVVIVARLDAKGETVRLGTGLNAADSANLLARLHAAWPETAKCGDSQRGPLSNL